MKPYTKIKASSPVYIGRLTLETKGIGKRIFHQMMFTNQLPSNSLGVVSQKNWMLISAQETRLSRGGRGASSPINLIIKFRTIHKKTAGNLVFHRVCLQFAPPVNFLFSGNRYRCSLGFRKNMKHRNLFFNRLELKDLLNHITFLFDDGHPFQSYVKAS